MTDLRILNLFAGPGGNRELWGENHRIVAVETDDTIREIYRDKFPHDTISPFDAYEFLLANHEHFDFIWASPPCTTHSRAKAQHGPYYRDFRLYEMIDFMQRNVEVPWVVENVVNTGITTFRPSAKLGRHFLWSNFSIPEVVFPPDNVQSLGSKDPNRNKMNPDIGKYILQCAFAQVTLERFL